MTQSRLSTFEWCAKISGRDTRSTTTDNNCSCQCQLGSLCFVHVLNCRVRRVLFQSTSLYLSKKSFVKSSISYVNNFNCSMVYIDMVCFQILYLQIIYHIFVHSWMILFLTEYQAFHLNVVTLVSISFIIRSDPTHYTRSFQTAPQHPSQRRTRRCGSPVMIAEHVPLCPGQSLSGRSSLIHVYFSTGFQYILRSICECVCVFAYTPHTERNM